MPLGDALEWCAARDVAGVELGVGGYSTAPHFSRAELISSAAARQALQDDLDDAGLAAGRPERLGQSAAPRPRDRRRARAGASRRGRARSGARRPPRRRDERLPRRARRQRPRLLAGVRRRRLAAGHGGPLGTAVRAVHRAVLARVLALGERCSAGRADLPGAAPRHVDLQRRIVRSACARSPATTSPSTSIRAISGGSRSIRSPRSIGSATRSASCTARTRMLHPDRIALHGLLDFRWPSSAE